MAKGMTYVKSDVKEVLVIFDIDTLKVVVNDLTKRAGYPYTLDNNLTNFCWISTSTLIPFPNLEVPDPSSLLSQKQVSQDTLKC